MTKGRAVKPRVATSSTRRRTRHTGRQPQVNDQVDIWWDVDKTYYRGRLSKQLDHHMHFRIVYDDGDTEDINLHNEFWKFVHPVSQQPPSFNDAPEFDQLSLDDDNHLNQPHQLTTNNSASSPLPASASKSTNKRHDPPPKPKPTPPAKSVIQTSVSTAPSNTTHPATTTVNTAPPPQKRAHPKSPQPSETPLLIDPAPLTNVSSAAKSQPPSEKPPRTPAKTSRPSVVKPKSHPANKSVASGKRRLSTTFQASYVTQQRQQHPAQQLTTTTVQPPQQNQHSSPKHSSPTRRPTTMTPNHSTAAHPHAVTQSTAPNQGKTRTPSSSHSASTPVDLANKPATITSQKTKKRRLHSLRTEDNTHGSTQSSPPHASTAAAVATASIAAAQLRRIKRDETVCEDMPEPSGDAQFASKSPSLPIKVSLKRSALQPSLLSTKQSVMNQHENTGSHNATAVRDARLHALKTIDKELSEHGNKESVHRGNDPSCAPNWNERDATKILSSGGAENNATGAGTGIGASAADSRGPTVRLQQFHDGDEKDHRIGDDPNLDFVSPASGHAERDAGIDEMLGRKLAPIERHMSKLTDEVHVIRGGFDSTRQLVETANRQKESFPMKEIKSTLSALDQKVALLCEHIGSVQEQLKAGLADNLSIKRELARVVSLLQQEPRFTSQREQAMPGNTGRVPDVRQPPRVQPTANGSVNPVRRVSAVPSRGGTYSNVHHYPTTPFPAPRNVIQYQQRAAPTGDVVREVRQPPTGEVVREVRQPQNVVQVQRNEANANPQQATYSVNYTEGRNAQESFTYQVLDLVARQITVWLLETPHEHHKSGMALELWAKHTSSTAYARIAPRLAMFRSYVHASSTLSISLNNNASELTWFIRPYETGCTSRARRNYNAWDPPPTDEEWKSETVLLKELASGFHRAFQSYGPLESTVLATSVALTRRTARDYEEAGYRPLLPGP